MRNETTGAVSWKFEPDYANNVCAARCASGPKTIGDTWDGDIEIVKNLSADVKGCRVSALCYLSDLSLLPKDDYLFTDYS